MKQNCIRCPALVKCRTQIVYADPCKHSGLLVIGEAPGRDEDIKGEGFIGTAGKTLDRIFADFQIKRTDYGRANICRCRPPENRKPTREEIDACLPFLAELIIELKPKVILTIGATPTKVFCGDGALYSKIIASRNSQGCNSSNYIDLAHQEIKKALTHTAYIVPSPHTSPLAFNRDSPSGEKWGAITKEQIKIAVNLLHLDLLNTGQK